MMGPNVEESPGRRCARQWPNWSSKCQRGGARNTTHTRGACRGQGGTECPVPRGARKSSKPWAPLTNNYVGADCSFQPGPSPDRPACSLYTAALTKGRHVRIVRLLEAQRGSIWSGTAQLEIGACGSVPRGAPVPRSAGSDSADIRAHLCAATICTDYRWTRLAVVPS